ncbi:AraC family transcriptional regulator [Paenibacillus flagellatus]|uniref:HTH araC/xylS-type domain-containing protein n=1 Tax=Paenibacillus flagellatus TaxID=2211139 RepID=A0A2V5JUX2_9BACL|nr:AraC family transcriptional regulator [Paenibacillus flagellatus]PYI50485.1 hypothetical protein DLM86_28705 [Paenibacillus flagellatus]
MAIHYAMSRSAFLDVKWAALHTVRESFSLEQHYNPYFELIAVTEGPVHLQAEEEKVVLHAGDTFLLRPWERHKGWNPAAQGGEFYWVQFAATPEPRPFDFAKDRLPVGLEAPHGPSDLRTVPAYRDETMIVPRRFRSSGRFHLLGLFEQLVREMDEAKGYYRYRSSLLLGTMLERLASDLLGHVRQETTLPASYVTYRSLVSLLDNQYPSSLTRETLEAQLDRKYEYLCGVFKKYAGMTIGAYVRHLRVQRAQYLLQATEDSVQSIAAEVGIADPFTFSKLFKKLVGRSPADYRNEIRNKPRCPDEG